MVGGQVNPVICVIIDNMCYYKVRQVLQSATIITKCDSFFITKCDKCYYKMRQVFQSVTILLQSSTVQTYHLSY